MSQTFRFIIINLKFLLEYVCMHNKVKYKKLKGSIIIFEGVPSPSWFGGGGDGGGDWLQDKQQKIL